LGRGEVRVVAIPHLGSISAVFRRNFRQFTGISDNSINPPGDSINPAAGRV
jgi:hypothetical protein